jgi:secondary thiamine-phosphate synthase enzyme
MAVHGGMLRLLTRGHGEIVDISAGVRSIVEKSGVERGTATVFVTGSTAAITTMEYEPGGVEDLSAALERLIPVAGDYAHNARNHDTNAYAHMRAALIGASESIPVVAGKLVLGTWQQIVLLDFDDSERERQVTVQIVS